MKKTIMKTTLALVILVSLALTSLLINVNASHVNCGDTISSDTTLDRNLRCSGTGLTIVTDGVTLDLGGHHIIGDGTGSGIYVGPSVDNVIIRDGTVSNFNIGIEIEGSPGNHTTGNQVINVTSRDHKLTAEITGGSGVSVSWSDDAVVRDSHIFTLEGSGADIWESNDFTFQGNHVHNIGTETQIEGTTPCGTGNGIFIYADGGTIRDNHFHDISQSGILYWGHTSGVIEGNRVHDTGTRPCPSTDFGGISVVARASNIDVVHNRIYQNHLLSGIGLRRNVVNINIEYNWIFSNPSGGIELSRGATGTTVNDNNIHNNGPFGLRRDPTDSVAVTYVINAENNWWGHPTGPFDPTGNLVIVSGNPSGKGDAVLFKTTDSVDYVPWRTRPAK